jgi:cysteine synthase A
VPPILNLEFLDEIIAVEDGDAILMAQKLARELGLGVGISSGANFIGALKVQDTLDEAATVVTVFCDDNKKYLSTDLCREEPVRGDYLTPSVRLIGFDVFKRVCITCWEPTDTLSSPA